MLSLSLQATSKQHSHPHPSRGWGAVPPRDDHAHEPLRRACIRAHNKRTVSLVRAMKLMHTMGMMWWQ
jgi:hypothetical protein